MIEPMNLHFEKVESGKCEAARLAAERAQAGNAGVMT